MSVAIYPGSFDPITLGHLDIIKRASQIFDEVVIGVLYNSQKKALFTPEERVAMISDLIKDIPGVKVESFEGLTIDFAHKHGAKVVVRGLRAVTDFEYELQIAQSNNVVSPDIETVFLITSMNYSFLSSTVVREYASYGSDISKFVPESVIPLVESKYNNPKNGRVTDGK